MSETGTSPLWLGPSWDTVTRFCFHKGRSGSFNFHSFLCSWYTLKDQHMLRHFPSWVSAGLWSKGYPQANEKLDGALLLSTLLHAQQKHSFLTSVTYSHQYFSRKKKKISSLCQAWLYCLKQKLRKSNCTLWPLHLATPQCCFILVSI